MIDAKKMEVFKQLIDKHVSQEGPQETTIKDFFVFKDNHCQQQKTEVYDSGIIIVASGKKRFTLNGRSYDYSAGNYLAMFLPMPVEVEAVDASPENPLLLIGLRLHLSKFAEMLLKLDQHEYPTAKASKLTAGLFSAPLKEELLDPVIRLLKTLDKPSDSAILSPGIIEEIYYRILCDEHTGAIKHLLQQRGQIQQISRAVSFINQNLHEAVVIEELAELANMSVSHFHKNFKEVMQMSPLQYAKSMKLFKAQSLMQAGLKANQAAFEVGYNSPAQFSREYKRQFGVTPSARQA